MTIVKYKIPWILWKIEFHEVLVENGIPWILWKMELHELCGTLDFDLVDEFTLKWHFFKSQKFRILVF